MTKDDSQISMSPDSGSDEEKLHDRITQHLQSGAEDPNSRQSDESERIQSVGPFNIETQKYETGECIAKGGMGAILNARDLNIKRRVAMKVLLDEKRNSQDNTLRFMEEAQITGQLEHPSIVPVYELGVNSAGEVFYAMKLVKGATFKEIIAGIRSGDMQIIENYPLSRLLTIFQKVCDAIAYAHSKHVIHRDLKPENIMIGDFGEVLVMDWGLAKILSKDSYTDVTTIRSDVGSSDSKVAGDITAADDSGVKMGATVSRLRDNSLESFHVDEENENLHTMDGQILGTPNFMAPEQATAQNDKIDTRADIYALGGILYNLTTLRVPISGRSFTDMLVNIVKGNIAPPSSFNDSSKSATDSDEEKFEFHHCPSGKIPESLSAVAMKALALHPEDRYPDVKTLQEEIEAYQGGFATDAEEAGLLRQLVLFIRRHKTITTILTASVVGLVSVVTVFIAQLQSKNIDLNEKSLTLEKQNIRLGSQKITLEEQRTDLQNTLDQLIEEKRRTEVEREAKKAEQRLKVEEKIAKEKEIRRRKEVSKLSAPEFIKRGQILIASLEWKEALTAVETALELDVSLGDGWYLKGRLQLGNLEFSDALLSFARSDEPDAAGLREISESYHSLTRTRSKPLTTEELRELSNLLRLKKDYILSERIFTHTMEREKLIFSDVNLARQRLIALNSELASLKFRYSFDGDILTVDLSNNRKLSNITPLTGLPINRLQLQNTNVTDFTPMNGMPLEVLHVSTGSEPDPPTLKKLPLKEIHFHGTPRKDLKSIRSITKALPSLHLYGFEGAEDYALGFLDNIDPTEWHLFLHGSDYIDLNLFLNVPLTRLTLVDSEIYDITPLRQHELVTLDLTGTRVKSIRILKGKSLRYLALAGTDVRDLSVLKDMPLEFLDVQRTKVRSIDALRGSKIVHLNIGETDVTDYSVLREIPLQNLYLDKMPIVDLSFLGRMELIELSLSDTYVSDIRILKDMPLQKLNLSGTRVRDISPLKRMRLSFLSLSNTPVTNIDVVSAMPLRHLDISRTSVNDLSPLAGMNLTYLSVGHTQAGDLSPLDQMPLTNLSIEGCDLIQTLAPLSNCKNIQEIIVPKQISDLGVLRSLRSLEHISYTGKLGHLEQTAEEFWEAYKKRRN